MNWEPEDKKSKYNQGLSQLFRIDNLWQSSQYYRGAGLINKWNDRLDMVWTELAADADKEDEKVFIRYMKVIIENRGKKKILNQILMSKEIWLRKLQNKQGKGTAYLDESEDDFD